MKNIAEHILDITQNSISANAATIEITIKNSQKSNQYTLSITDNGIGMDDDTVKKIIDPFYTSRTTRKVGLGIPLLKQNCEITGGYLNITSHLGKGTTLNANFTNNSIDRIPEGDISSTIVLLVISNTNINFIFKYITDKSEYVFNTTEINKILGDISIIQTEIRTYLVEMINENIKDIC